jgi:hypothetical protein
LIIDALAKGYFLMGVTQAIKVTLMQKDPATLNEAIREAMKLEDINESNGSGGKVASPSELEDKDLAKIVDNLDDLTIKLINSRRAKFGIQPFKRGNQFQPRKPGKGSNGQSVIKCRHCNKEGHMQLECRT